MFFKSFVELILLDNMFMDMFHKSREVNWIKMASFFEHRTSNIERPTSNDELRKI